MYIGFTGDLKKRFQEHNLGKTKYTKPFIPWLLVYYEAYTSKIDAQNREYQFKKHAKAWGQLKKRINNSIYES